MTRDEFESRYRLIQEVTRSGGATTHHALGPAGAVVMVHFLDAATEPRVRGVLALPEEERPDRFVTVEEVDGSPVLVTRFIMDFRDLGSWLDQVGAPSAGGGRPEAPSPGPPPSAVEGPPARKEAAGGTPPGEFTALFRSPAAESPDSPPAGPRESGTPPAGPAAPRESPEGETRPSAGGGEESGPEDGGAPGEFTALFRARTSEGEPVETPESAGVERPGSPESVAGEPEVRTEEPDSDRGGRDPGEPSDAFRRPLDAPREAGEFTRLFRAADAPEEASPATPEKAPPGPPEEAPSVTPEEAPPATWEEAPPATPEEARPAEVSGPQEGSPQPARPEPPPLPEPPGGAPGIPPSPPPSGTGEFTRLFEAPPGARGAPPPHPPLRAPREEDGWAPPPRAPDRPSAPDAGRSAPDGPSAAPDVPEPRYRQGFAAGAEGPGADQGPPGELTARFASPSPPEGEDLGDRWSFGEEEREEEPPPETEEPDWSFEGQVERTEEPGPDRGPETIAEDYLDRLYAQPSRPAGPGPGGGAEGGPPPPPPLPGGGPGPTGSGAGGGGGGKRGPSAYTRVISGFKAPQPPPGAPASPRAPGEGSGGAKKDDGEPVWPLLLALGLVLLIAAALVVAYVIFVA